MEMETGGFGEITFNKPFLTGNETKYIIEAVRSEKISGDGSFTAKCHAYFERKFGFHKVLLTTSCTDALEMAALLLDIKPGDEVIAPAFTFVSTVNAFVLRGAKIIFVDSSQSNPNLEADKIAELITPRTKVILPVHYAGIACDMDKIMAIAAQHGISVVEDAAQAIDSYHKGVPLGSIGCMGAFSFHETKNIISGEGGMLAINDTRFTKRAEIIREKGTNRSAFFRGEIDKYGWVDIGSSFLPSDVIAAFLFAQLENLEMIQLRRKHIWNIYDQLLAPLKDKGVKLPFIPAYATNNAHMYYIVCRSLSERTELINTLRANKIAAVFHYQSLHKSPFYQDKHDGRPLPMSDHYTDCLLRLPMFFQLEDKAAAFVAETILDFYRSR
jgi:dTDP-4-amino-4,6-dideoxygalactose transaminase